MEKITNILIDTNIIIDALNGIDKYDEFLSEQDNLVTSTVCFSELIQGSKKKNQINKIIKTIESTFTIIELNSEISILARKLIAEYSHKQGLDYPDSLIAATCMVNGYQLATLNTKHFKGIKGLKLVKI